MAKDPRRLRRRSNNPNVDPNETENQSYNTAGGVRKVSDFGKRLKPGYFTPPSTYTTDFSSRKKIGRGIALAIYNNSATPAALTFGDSAVAALAIGATDANGGVGIALKANDWTYLNSYSDEWAITTAATAIVYVIEDDTDIQLQS